MPNNTPHPTPNRGGASFFDLLRGSGAAHPSTATVGYGIPTTGPRHDGRDARSGSGPEFVHATTIVALRYAGGVVMAGDRRATMGNVIAHRAMRKVFPADQWSAVSISGVAGMAEEMVKLFQLELEHYEKVEGLPLSLEGKATRLSNMVRANLPMALQAGMVVIPIFAGYDRRRQVGRIFNYDVTGGRYEEVDFHATGSGGIYARTVLKLRWIDHLTADDAARIAVEALFEAAEEDSATGGPDGIRGIYPTVATIDADGYRDLTDDEVAAHFDALLAQRRANGGRAVGTVGVTGAVTEVRTSGEGTSA